MRVHRPAGYSLIGHDPIPFDDLLTWASAWEMLRERGGHIVRQEYVGPIHVSTVFLGIDHNWMGGTPILFETMTFGPDEGIQQRYSTWDEALAGHEAIVAQLQAELVAPTN